MTITPKLNHLLVSGNKCPRCQLNLDTPHYSEGKKIICSYCGSIAFRVTVRYKKSYTYESYKCTNELCGIMIKIVKETRK